MELANAQHPVNLGMPGQFAGMFERSPAFETKPGFQGTVLASYPKSGNPLASGFLLHGERLNGKAAAVDVQLGKGHVVLFGFRPQWRGQSHGTYKMVFNALYLSNEQVSPIIATPAASNPLASTWAGLSQGLRTDIGRLHERNKSFFAARGTGAVEQSASLHAAVEEVRRGRLASIDEFRQNLEDKSAARKVSDYITQARRLLADLLAKSMAEASSDSIFEQYRLAALETEVSVLLTVSAKSIR